MGKNSNAKWTPEDDRKLLELKAVGKRAVVIAAALQRTEMSVVSRFGILKSRLAKSGQVRPADEPDPSRSPKTRG
jgi:hypothetical protein